MNPRHTDLNEWDRLAKEEAKREGRAKEDVSNKVIYLGTFRLLCGLVICSLIIL